MRGYLLPLISALACRAPEHDRDPPAAPVEQRPPGAAAAESPTMSETRLAEAERRLAGAAVVLTPRTTPPPVERRWPGVTSRVYAGPPDTGLELTVWVHADDAAAAAGEPAIAATVRDGTRTAVIRRGAIVFLLEGAGSLPSRPAPAEANAAFDAVRAALTAP